MVGSLILIPNARRAGMLSPGDHWSQPHGQHEVRHKRQHLRVRRRDGLRHTVGAGVHGWAPDLETFIIVTVLKTNDHNHALFCTNDHIPGTVPGEHQDPLRGGFSTVAMKCAR